VKYFVFSSTFQRVAFRLSLHTIRYRVISRVYLA